MSPQIEHDREAHRLTATVDGLRCLLLYKLKDDIMTIVHTEVPEALAGHGIGGDLVRAAFELARSESWRVVPACSYAAAFVRKHTEYADLLA